MRWPRLTDHGRARCRHVFVVVLLLASVAAIGATQLRPTALERCVDDAAATWNGTGSELWTECAEQVAP